MISKDRQCKCLSAETGTVVFAIINIFVVSTSCLLSMIGLVYWSIALYTVSLELEEDDYKYAGYVLPTLFGRGIGVVFALLSSLVALIFAVFLLHGVVKKKSEHLKAYFVYGVVVNVLCLCAVFIYLAFLFIVIAGWGDYVSIGVQLVPVAIVVVFCFIYSLILSMIRTVYRKMQSHNVQYRHQLLETLGPQKY